MKTTIDIWFMLTVKQRRKLSELGVCHVMFELCEVNTLKRVTKNKDIINALIELKRSKLRLVS